MLTFENFYLTREKIFLCLLGHGPQRGQYMPIRHAFDVTKKIKKIHHTREEILAFTHGPQRGQYTLMSHALM